MTNILNKSLLLAASALLLSACLGGGSGSSGGTGQLSLSVTDAPVDEAEAVVVSFTGVVLQPQSGERLEIDFDVPRQIDLLQLTGSASEPLLEDVTVPAGGYNWIRLKVLNGEHNNDDTYITIGGSAYPLWIPSGDQRGLQLVSGFDVPLDGHGDFTIDFDLRKAVTKPVGKDHYHLRPALRLVQTAATGSLTGGVHPDVIAAAQVDRLGACVPAVYVYTADVTVPADLGGPEDRAPVTSTVVELVDGDYLYSVGFLPAGDYLPVFTCDADLDDPDVYDNEGEVVVRLLEGDMVIVIAGQTTVYDFE